MALGLILLIATIPLGGAFIASGYLCLLIVATCLFSVIGMIFISSHFQRLKEERHKVKMKSLGSTWNLSNVNISTPPNNFFGQENQVIISFFSFNDLDLPQIYDGLNRDNSNILNNYQELIKFEQKLTLYERIIADCEMDVNSE